MAADTAKGSRGKGKRGERMTDIDWNRFDADFVRLDENIPKKLMLANWRQGSWFNMPGIRFEVVEEDLQKVSKVFTTTSKRLIRAIKPFIMKAETEKKSVIYVSITRIGEGLNTFYEVQSIRKLEQKENA